MVGSGGTLLYLQIQKFEFLLQTIRHEIFSSLEKEGVGKAVLIFQGECNEVPDLQKFEPIPVSWAAGSAPGQFAMLDAGVTLIIRQTAFAFSTLEQPEIDQYFALQ